MDTSPSYQGLKRERDLLFERLSQLKKELVTSEKKHCRRLPKNQNEETVTNYGAITGLIDEGYQDCGFHTRSQ